MERMYQEYKDIVEFRIVYISEAHAIDDARPNQFAELKGIYEHKDSGQRCSTAEMMMQEENITIPCIIDDMDNNVSVAYKALPDRLYVVQEDGRLAVAAERGPRGWQSIEKWLKAGSLPKLNRGAYFFQTDPAHSAGSRN